MKQMALKPYEVIIDPGEIDTHFAHTVCLDLEMFGQDKDRLHTVHGTFACLAMSLSNGSNYIVNDPLLISGALARVNHLEWVIQNATYDIRQLRAFATIDPRPIFDPMLVEKILWSGYYNTFGLQSLVRRYFGGYMEKDKYEEIRDQTISKSVLYDYATLDAYMTMRVADIQRVQLDDNPDLKRVYETIDAPMIWVVLDMPPARVSVEGWLTLAKENESKGRSIESEIGLNVFSYNKVKEMLATEYNLGLDSTEDEVLAEYKHLPIIQKIREARSYRKAASTYGNAWIEKHTDGAGDVYCNWNVIGAATGRMSSDNPNLQNIPARKMPVFRNLFVPRYERLIIADVSQQEPRITALRSKDRNLISMFVNHEDVHLMVTRMLFEDETIEKSDPRRKIGKEINLGVVYGLTALGLLARLKEVMDDPSGLDESRCQGYIDRYFDKFPRVRAMLDRDVQVGHRNEYTTTPYGRRAWINIHASGWENNCKNNPVQGGGADMTKMWLVEMWNACRSADVRFPICMVVHDELVLDVGKEEVDYYVRMLDETFKKAINQLFPGSPVPFEFEFSIGENWGEKA